MTTTAPSSLGVKTLALAAVMTGVLLFMIAERALLLGSDTTVMLRTAPVDPTSLFRGKYDTLTYDITTLATTDLNEANLAKGDKVYVTLKQDGTFWAADGLSVTKPNPDGGRPVIRGTVKWIGARNGGASRSLRIDYGIESYFVPESQAGMLERAARDRTNDGPERVTVEVALGKSGKAAIKTVFLDGKPVVRETVF